MSSHVTFIQRLRRIQNVKDNPVSLKQVAEVTGGKLSGAVGAVVTDVTHDSRGAGPGSLFVAVRGELFDGHKFIPQVIEQGAVGVMSELEPPIEFQAATTPA